MSDIYIARNNRQMEHFGLRVSLAGFGQLTKALELKHSVCLLFRAVYMYIAHENFM